MAASAPSSAFSPSVAQPVPQPVDLHSTPPWQEGWELLVGPLGGRAVVCLDDGGPAITALAQRCARVRVLAADGRSADELAQRVRAHGWTHVEVIALEDLHRAEAVTFDGLIVSDLSGRALAKVRGGLGRLLTHARPLLRDGAFVLLATPNRFGLSRARFARRLHASSASPWFTLASQLRRLGVRSPRVHPLLLNEYAGMSEAIAPTGYLPTKNQGLTRERIKQWLWGPRAARWFAPALAAVGWIGDAQPGLIDAVALTLQAGGSQFHWVQYLVLLSGKVIATFRPDSDRETSRVVVVTRDPLAVSRRMQEAESLRRLHAMLPAHLGVLLPRVLDRFKLDGNDCFVLQHMRGVTADALVPGLDRVTRTAQRFLLALHEVTCVKRVMDEEAWETSLQPIFDSAVLRNPHAEPALRRLGRHMREHVLGHVWLDVCSHGDFKIENVMYDPQTCEITGVIDWEHAMLCGLPYIDMAYLLTYNRMLGGESWLQAARALLTGRVSPNELAVEADYWRATRLPERLVPVLRALVVVHHIGCRWHGQWSTQASAELNALIESCIELLVRSPAPAALASVLPPAPAQRAAVRPLG